MSTQAVRKIDAPVPNALTPTPDQFAMLRQTIDALEKQSTPGAQRGDGNSAPAGRRSRSRKGQPSMSTTTPQAAQPAPTPTPGGNALTLATMLTIAGELGAQEALGKDGQVKFDLKVAEAAFVGAIDLAKDKHGQGIDDATQLAAAYVKGRNSSVIFDHKEPKQRKLVSNVRTMVKLGSSPKYGVGEPMATLNALMTTRQNLRRTANKGVKLDDAHNTLMRFAREQLKRDTLYAGDELKQFCFKAESDPRSGKEVLQAIQRMATNLKNGKVSNCPDLDNSPEVNAIINACNKRLSAIAKAEGAAQGGQQAA
jgi:hypothetical protein